MGKKKPFVDKKKSVTFHLEPNRGVASTDTASATTAATTRPQSDGDDSANDYDRSQWDLGEFGFANDGYDYSQHMRQLGDGRYETSVPASVLSVLPSFVPEK